MSSVVSIIKISNSDLRFLYLLLKERDPRANISHRIMPTYAEHVKFVKSKPYKAWYVVYFGSKKAGSVYLSKQNEIGIFLLKKYYGNDIGQQALHLLMQKNPEKRYLANVNPKNSKSIKFFKKNKFKLIQYTYEFMPDDLP
ncbi:MAG: N-acetyltransferase [Nitrososphaeria archaeon]|nr:N-acetyltransferase [Nitrososphaeria archaeon]